MINLNLLFNKTYYSRLNQPDFEDSLKTYNQQIFDSVFIHERDYRASDLPTNRFILETTYPGLLVGTGNPHGGLSDENDISVGFSFDYVTGQPFIPGSSVRGVLRCYFREQPQAITEILDKTGIKKEADVAALEKELFGNGDVFLDAVVYDGDVKGHLMGSDFISRHPADHQKPMPVLIVKVLPGVRFEFRFILSDGTLTAAEKEKLYSLLIQMFGIGARTGVGYGMLKESGNEIKEKKPVLFGGTPEDAAQQILCPHCQAKNFVFYQDGVTRRKKCYRCKEFLYSKQDWEDLQ